MKILHNSFGVFWKIDTAQRTQFMADMFKFHSDETARDVAARHARMFPQDIICSVRGPDGRFQPFKGETFRPSAREAAAMAAELNRYRHG